MIEYCCELTADIVNITADHTVFTVYTVAVVCGAVSTECIL